MMLLEVQSALCILCLLDKRRGVMQVNKILLYFLVVIHASQNYIKQKCHKQLVMGSSRVSNYSIKALQV